MPAASQQSMNAKKSLAMLLSAAMMTAAAVVPAAAEEEKPVIKLSYPVLVVVPTEEGTQKVEDAVNEYLDSIDETFHVDLEPIEGYSYANTVDMALLGSTPMDVFLPFSGFQQAVNGNKVLPLNDYLENELAGAVEIMGEDYLAPCTIDGNVYAIPCYKGQVLIYYWEIRKDIFDQTGLDPYAEYTFDDMNMIMEKLAEVEPDIPVIAARLAASGGNNFMLDQVLGGRDQYELTTFTGGVAQFGDDTTLVNLYESEMFEKIVRTAWDWNEKGYVPFDSSIETEDSPNLVDADRAQSFIIGYAYSRDTIEGQTANSSQYEMYAIPMSEQIFNSSSFLYWCVAHKTEHPAEAARLLNMLYTDETLLNMVIFGLEGEDYVVEDESGIVKAINWPEGQTMETVPYTAALSCGIIGNQFIMAAMKGSTEVSDVEFMQDKIQNAKKSPLFGFSFDTTNVDNEVSAVSNVVNQYYGGLCCGELDPDEYLPKFQSDLKDAGIEDIIAEAQRQADEWLAAQEAEE